jgi:antitoxin HicB
MLTQLGLTLADLTDRYEAIMRTFLYPALLTPDTECRGFVVTFPDVPEGITQGDDISEALKQAADCLEEAVAGRIRRHEPIPAASAVGPDQFAISLPISTGLKAALYLALQQAKITPSELAAHLHCDEQDVTRLLDPRRTANVSRLESALKALGYQCVLQMQAMVIPPYSRPSDGEGKHGTVSASLHAS